MKYKFTTEHHVTLMFLSSLSMFLLLILEYFLDKGFLMFSVPFIIWLICDYIQCRKSINQDKKEYMVLRESWSDYKVLVSLLENKYDCQEYIDQCIKEHHLTM